MTSISTTVPESHFDSGAVNHAAIPEVSPHRPASLDWALLCLRAWFGLSIFMKHGTEKILRFNSTAATVPDPLHLGRAATLMIALVVEAIYPILVVLGIATRWVALVTFVGVFIGWTMGGHPAYFGKGVEADHGELMWLYLGAYAAMAIMGAGRFSLDWKLRTGRLARFVRLEPVCSQETPAKQNRIVNKVIWIAIILGIVTVSIWGVWMQKTMVP